MYEYINGKLTMKKLDSVCLDVNGVGYLCNISFKTYENLVELGELEKLYIHLMVKEDDLSLYAFKTEEERKLFKLFISMSGIGPKIALAILSMYSSSEIVSIVKNDDYKTLSRVNGLGVKKSQKLIIEVKDKIENILVYDENVFEISIIKNEIKLALESLGYNKIKLDDYISDEDIQRVKDSAKLMKTILIKISKK